MAAFATGALRGSAASAARDGDALAASLARIEAEGGGRLGVALLDTGSGILTGHRVEERFPMCSTFKVLAAGAVLARVDRREEAIERRVRFSTSDVVTASPVTKDHAGEDGMTLSGLCEAALTLSDNTAGNLLLTAIGGPAGLNRFARELGDETTRLDRIEPDLNEALSGDPRDTTSPAAMAANLRALVLGDVLSARSRDLLIGWLLGCRTGDARLRAGLPSGWRIGNKTGSGERGTANDLAAIWPPARDPAILSVYLTGSTASPERRSALIAEVGRAVVAHLAE